MRHITNIACLTLGWIFAIVGIVVIVLNNHAGASRVAIGAPEWWALVSATPISALFFIAYGSTLPPQQDAAEVSSLGGK
jgi:hypothetical protein